MTAHLHRLLHSEEDVLSVLDPFPQAGTFVHCFSIVCTGFAGVVQFLYRRICRRPSVLSVALSFLVLAYRRGGMLSFGFKQPKRETLLCFPPIIDVLLLIVKSQ